jgi:hypothetical protein
LKKLVALAFVKQTLPPTSRLNQKTQLNKTKTAKTISILSCIIFIYQMRLEEDFYDQDRELIMHRSHFTDIISNREFYGRDVSVSDERLRHEAYRRLQVTNVNGGDIVVDGAEAGVHTRASVGLDRQSLALHVLEHAEKTLSELSSLLLLDPGVIRGTHCLSFYSLTVMRD